MQNPDRVTQHTSDRRTPFLRQQTPSHQGKKAAASLRSQARYRNTVVLAGRQQRCCSAWGQGRAFEQRANGGDINNNILRCLRDSCVVTLAITCL